MGDPVILIPPMLCDARVFADQIAELSRDHPVLFAPTCGAGTMEDIAAGILKWAPPEFALAGAGMGGMVALEMLRRAPKRITRVALINANAQSDTPKTAADREPLMIAAKAGRFDDVIADRFAACRFYENSDMGSMGPLLHDMATGIGAENFVLQARAVQRRKDQQAVLRKIKQPALVISCDSDKDNIKRRQEFVAEMIPYSKHVVIHGAGLLPSLEQPKVLSRILRDWCRQPLVLR
jgi:pimeloyl-ACP methyl ester carboxylesterase